LRADPIATSSPSSTDSRTSSQLSVSHVSKCFGTTRVLDDVTLTISQGEFVTLLGPSGCGKTTLLRIVAGLETADAGEVVLDGVDLLPLPANRRPVNMVFQNYALFPHLNVFDNVAFGLRIRRTGDREVLARVRAALEMLQLESLAQRRTNELSGGQKQRAALARALVNEPALLLLDEPMSALDAKLRAQVRVELRQLQRRLAKTFLLVTHDQDEAMTVSDRILLMNAGKIEQGGAPADVYDHPASRFAAEFLGAANLIPAQREGPDRVQTKLGTLTVSRPLPWEAGTLAIRPERIRLSTQPAAPNRLMVRVRDVIYRGDHSDVFVEPGALRLSVDSSSTLRVGDTIAIELPPQYLEVLRD
jgi:spermidine/putrescine transport system ATP-binding protein